MNGHPPATFKRENLTRGAAVFISAILLAGCVHYEPRPISVTATAERLENRGLQAPELREFLEGPCRYPVPEWPPGEWRFEMLVGAAFYYHPDLALARARWRSARAAESTAQARPNPSVSVGPQYNINAGPQVTPWLAFADFEIPIETAGKRGHRIDQAREQTQAAWLETQRTAWSVRARLKQQLAALLFAEARLALLQEQQARRSDLVSRLEAKKQAGAVGSGEVSQSRLLLLKNRADMAEAEEERASARAGVASAIGVPLSALVSVRLPDRFEQLDSPEAELNSAEARRRALTSRPDVLAALANYEAAQSGLALAVARQYPDLKLSPGYEYDQGENKFGLMLGLELPVFSSGRGPILEAMERRSAAAITFEAVQLKALQEVDGSLAALNATKPSRAAAIELEGEHTAAVERVRRQVSAGAAEPVELIEAEIELDTARLLRLGSDYRYCAALARLEEAMQAPAPASWPPESPVSFPTP